jgi:cell division transport system permease protein
VYFVVMQRAQETFRVWQWVGASETFQATLIMVVVGLILAVVPTFLTTRKYLKV